MQTNAIFYIPVLDQENPNVANLTTAQKEQVQYFNAASSYTAGQVGSNLGDNKAARLNAISERFRFINARTTVLVNRRLESRTITWHLNNLNFAIGLIIPFMLESSSNVYKFTEDTSQALDNESIPNLLSLYTYELIQLATFLQS